ncbi:unnamed protein product [Brugia timori]|uniref:N-myc downstream regulated n=1 Tax=Brugia timori TaxID=42155 RepID=A0A0R3R163_9BILA|nr:unnamed protein product [Brugia timori]
MDAAPLPDHYVYPTMDGLVQIVDNCVEQFKIREFIGLGVGVGANVMLRYALQNQSKMDALILINCVATSAGWIEWFYQQHLPNPKNLSAFIEAYLNRTPISISRDGTMGPKLNVPVLQIVGGDSAFVKDSVELNARLNPADSEWLKLSGSGGLVLDDKPEGVAQAIILFLQGRGFVPTTNVQDMIRKISVQSTFDGGEEAMTVLENVNEMN